MCEPMNPAPPVTRYLTRAGEGTNWATRRGAFLAASEASRSRRRVRDCRAATTVVSPRRGPFVISQGASRNE